MTPTPHGQVPDTLIDLIDTYAETRHRYGRIYNAKTEAARNAVIEALSGVQALSAAPAVTSEQRRLIGVIADKIEYGPLFQSGICPKKDLARFVRNMLDVTPTAPAASPTLPAEQQAAPKAAPGEQDDHQILAITTAYEQGVGKGHQAYKSGKEIANPYSPAYRCDLAWQYGYKEGKEQAQREATAAPQQEAQEPCPTCVALARTVMLDKVSFDRKPDCYGIRQITDDEGVEEWEDIRTSPDVAREEANDMMATGRGEIYEVVPLYTAPLPAPDCHHRPPCDECAAIAAQGGK